jgi:uncharacterized protein (DUF1330 family)
MAAYVFGDVEVMDPAAYDEYRKQVPAVIAAFGGRYLARGAPAEVLSGGWQLKRTVVLEFPSVAAAKAFWASPEYQPLRAIRERAAKSNLVLVEGL